MTVTSNCNIGIVSIWWCDDIFASWLEIHGKITRSTEHFRKEYGIGNGAEFLSFYLALSIRSFRSSRREIFVSPLSGLIISAMSHGISGG